MENGHFGWMDGWKVGVLWPLNGIWALLMDGWKVGVFVAPKWNMCTLNGWMESWSFCGP